MQARPRHFPIARAFVQLLRFILPAIVLFLSTTSADAQDRLREGVRVRVSTRSSHDIVGVVRSISDDSLSIFSGDHGAILSIPSTDIRGVQVSQGKSAFQGAKRGAVWGAGAGAIGAALLLVAAKSDDSYQWTSDDLTYVAVNSVVGGIIWGAGIGAFVRSERWQPVSFRPRVARSSSGVGFGLSLESSLLH
jgi:hypothetical protein